LIFFLLRRFSFLVLCSWVILNCILVMMKMGLWSSGFPYFYPQARLSLFSVIFLANSLLSPQGLGIQSRALYILGKCCTTDLHPQSNCQLFLVWQFQSVQIFCLHQVTASLAPHMVQRSVVMREGRIWGSLLWFFPLGDFSTLQHSFHIICFTFLFSQAVKDCMSFHAGSLPTHQWACVNFT
jgi:hypothetical protein